MRPSHTKAERDSQTKNAAAIKKQARHGNTIEKAADEKRTTPHPASRTHKYAQHGLPEHPAQGGTVPSSNQEEYPYPPLQLIRNIARAEELAVLYMLYNNEKIESIARKLNKPVEEIKRIIEELYKKKIILNKEPTYIINPIATWNNLYFVFIKIEWRPPLHPPLDEYPTRWPEVVREIAKTVEEDGFLKQRVFAVFNLQGIEWDILLIVGANDKSELRRIIEKIVALGVVSKVWSFAADSEGWYLRLFSPPPLKGLKQGKHLLEIMEKLESYQINYD